MIYPYFFLKKKISKFFKRKQSLTPTIKKENRANSSNNITTPCPAHYNPDFNAVTDISNKMSMGKRVKDPSFIMRNPGPGTYDVENRIGSEAPHISFGKCKEVQPKPKTKSRSVIDTRPENTDYRVKHITAYRMVKHTNEPIINMHIEMPGSAKNQNCNRH